MREKIKALKKELKRRVDKFFEPSPGVKAANKRANELAKGYKSKN